ncbi:MAG: response regulator transcription factor [Alistipes indistinctus]|jgi:DNA-binding CsgD family transcriptional regulator
MEEEKELTDALFSVIEIDYPQAFKALSEIYNKSKVNAPYFKYRCAHRFIRCNFGMYDKVPDVDELGRFNFENVACPLVGECKYYKVICNPEFNTNLTMREKEIVRLYKEGCKTERIAEILSLSQLTVETHKRNAMRRTGSTTLAELVIWANNHGL